MKLAKLTAIFLVIVFSLGPIAGEMTGAGKRVLRVLQENNVDFSQLRSSGHSLLLGEFTGAGKSVKLDQIRIYVTEKDVYFKEEIDHVALDSRATVYPRGDFRAVSHIEVNGHVVPKSRITALIVK